jgi:hypothetical protein
MRAARTLSGPRAVLSRFLYLPGGQCGLLLPVAPRHCLSPGPGASPNAAGATEAANTHTVNSSAPQRFTFVMELLSCTEKSRPVPESEFVGGLKTNLLTLGSAAQTQKGDKLVKSGFFMRQ